MLAIPPAMAVVVVEAQSRREPSSRSNMILLSFHCLLDNSHYNDIAGDNEYMFDNTSSTT